MNTTIHKEATPTLITNNSLEIPKQTTPSLENQVSEFTRKNLHWVLGLGILTGNLLGNTHEAKAEQPIKTQSDLITTKPPTPDLKWSFGGQFKISALLAASGYRQSSSFGFNFNGPSFKSLSSRFNLTGMTIGQNGLALSTDFGIGANLEITKRKETHTGVDLSIKPSAAIGYSHFFPGLNNKELYQSISAPFVMANLEFPFSIGFSKTVDGLFVPNISLIKYLRPDLSMNIDDKNMDKKPDFLRPNLAAKFGTFLGVKYDNNNSLGINTYIDPFDPSVPKGLSFGLSADFSRKF